LQAVSLPQAMALFVLGHCLNSVPECKELCMKSLTLLVLLVVAHQCVAEGRPSQSIQPGSTSQAAPQSTVTSSDKAAKEAASSVEYSPGIGTVIVAELSNSISAKKTKVGDRVECTVVSDLLYEGKIVVPRYAKVVGRVTEAEAFTKEHRESRLGLTFEKILLKDKKELVFQGPAIVVALAPPAKGTVRTTTEVRDMPVQMEKGGQSSPGGPSGGSTTGSSVLNAITTNPNLLGGNMGSSTGAIGGNDRGVIGWAGLYLVKGAPGTSVIASPKNTVELGFQTQMVLRVVEANK
jgi:hypothetical protein